MRRFTRFCVGLFVLALVLSSCSTAAPTPTAAPPPSKQASSPATTSSTSAQATALAPATTTAPVASKPTGTLKVALIDLRTETFLPHTESTQFVMGSTYEFLYYRDANGNVIPGLAERWDISPDGLTYTFHLRKGVQFHDNWGELTADDVKFTYELGTTKGTTNPTMQTVGPVMDKVEVVDRHTVTFRLKQFSVFFWPRIGREATPAFPIVSKKYVETVGMEQANKHPIGSGPYKFVEHVFGDHVTLEAMDNHWRKTASFKTLILRKVSEEATRVNMLRAGEVDVIEISTDFVPGVLKEGFQTKSSAGSWGYVLNPGGQYYGSGIYDPKYPWVGDPKDPKVWERALKVRKALALAVNKDEIIQTLLAGTGGPYPAPYILFPAIPGAVPGMKPYPFDPQEAKRLLAEAGYPQGFDINLKVWSTGGGEEAPTLAQAVAMMWEKIGVKTKLEIIEYQVGRGLMSKKSPEAFAWIYSVRLYEEPVMGYKLLAHAKSQYAWGGYDHPELDKLIVEADAEPNSEKRAALQRQMTQLVYDNYLTVPLATKNSTWAVNKRVGDWTIAPSMGNPTNWESITHGPAFKQ